MKLDYLKGLLLVLSLGLGSGYAGYTYQSHRDFDKMYQNGYLWGKTALAHDLSIIAGVKPDEKGFDKSKLEHFFSYHAAAYYIYKDGHFKTITSN